MDVQAHIAKLCKRIVERFRPQKVILFGSYAWGTPNYHSDIDLLVVMPFSASIHDQTVKVRRALSSELPLDVLVRTPEQIRARVEINDFFMKRIVDQGKVLYEESDA
ncbi:MAG: nucleotidyltransferase domain-containing protein [Pyrinomonadaceae bacterium]|nr:nucleotidyltransferase domain-containing protein [Pyrinomonadaceae bacterium]